VYVHMNFVYELQVEFLTKLNGSYNTTQSTFALCLRKCSVPIYVNSAILYTLARKLHLEYMFQFLFFLIVLFKLKLV